MFLRLRSEHAKVRRQHGPKRERIFRVRSECFWARKGATAERANFRVGFERITAERFFWACSRTSLKIDTRKMPVGLTLAHRDLNPHAPRKSFFPKEKAKVSICAIFSGLLVRGVVLTLLDIHLWDRAASGIAFADRRCQKLSDRLCPAGRCCGLGCCRSSEWTHSA